MYISYICFVYVTYYALMHPYCVSNILQRRKPVDKMRWNKLLFFKLYFQAKYNFLYRK